MLLMLDDEKRIGWLGIDTSLYTAFLTLWGDRFPLMGESIACASNGAVACLCQSNLLPTGAAAPLYLAHLATITWKQAYPLQVSG
jgi:hypothetical protein